MNTQIALTDLAEQSGYKLNHLVQLVRRGILKGKKEGKTVYVSEQEAKAILAKHELGKRWPKQITRQWWDGLV